MIVKIARTHLRKYKVIIKLYIEAKLSKTVWYGYRIDKEISEQGVQKQGLYLQGKVAKQKTSFNKWSYEN